MIKKKEFNILSLGAGVQSSTLALMAENNQIIFNDKVHKIDFAVFADTKAEPEEVYKWLSYLQSIIKSFPIYIVAKGSLVNDNTIYREEFKQLNFSIPFFTQSFDNHKPGMLQRRCTRDYKIRPIINFIKKELNIRSYREYERILLDPEIGYKKGNIKYNVTYPNITVNQFIGISTDEISRVKPSAEKWLINTYPLIEMSMSRSDCINWMEENNLPKPPRSACWMCPYHSDNEWINLKQNHPNDFQKAVEFERKIQKLYKTVSNLNGTPFLHKSCKTIDEIEFNSGDNDKHFNNECFGMCNN